MEKLYWRTMCFLKFPRSHFFIHDYENKIIEIINKNLHIEGGKRFVDICIKIYKK